MDRAQYLRTLTSSAHTFAAKYWHKKDFTASLTMTNACCDWATESLSWHADEEDKGVASMIAGMSKKFELAGSCHYKLQNFKVRSSLMSYCVMPLKLEKAAFDMFCKALAWQPFATIGDITGKAKSMPIKQIFDPLPDLPALIRRIAVLVGNDVDLMKTSICDVVQEMKDRDLPAAFTGATGERLLAALDSLAETRMLSADYAEMQFNLGRAVLELYPLEDYPIRHIR